MEQSRTQKPRSLWWRVHSWAGLKLSIFMTFILATGTIAVFAHELDWLVTPAMRVQVQERPVASWGALAEAAAAAEPSGRLQILYAPIDPWFAAEAWVEVGKGSPRRVYLDPWTARVTGTHGWANVHRLLRQLHRHLMLPTRIGIPIVSSLALLLLASLVTGTITYKKWWRGFLRMPRRGDTRRLNGDLHRLAGLWSLWFVALISLTGLWYLVEALGGNAAVPKLPEIAQGTSTRPPTGRALDHLVHIGQQARPTLHIREIRFTKENGVILLGQDQAWLVRDRANGLVLDPNSGEMLAELDGRDLSVHQRVSEMADPLHFGTFGGLATKAIWFIFGLMMTALSVTGTIIYAKRVQKADRAEASATRLAWSGMGLWAYVAVALIIMAIILTPGAIAGAS
ncbi:MAG: PepSY-associated TM helix domain-containing protein [Pseudomonadota bacterium]